MFSVSLQAGPDSETRALDHTLEAIYCSLHVHLHVYI